jgi:hypothetical protein
LDTLKRKVISRYFEDEQDAIDPTVDNLDFAGYLKKKNRTPISDSDMGDSNYNPYDYQDPSSKDKNIGDSDSFYKDTPEYPATGRKKVFDSEQPLGYWQEVRRDDETADPEEQAPKMSLDCKFASVNNVVAEFLLSHMPVVTTFNDLNQIDSCGCSKTAATLSEIISKHRHKSNSIDVLDSRDVSLSWKKFNSNEGLKKGFVVFKASSAGSSETHSVYFQFLKDDEEDVTDPDKIKSYIDLPVALSCSCESFLWYGAQWYALQGMYMYMPALRRSILPPVPEWRISRKSYGKGLNFRVCKHILACYDVIKDWQIKTVFKTMMKYTPLSRIINPAQWKQSFGVDFTYNNIMKYLKNPSPIPSPIKNFFRYKKETPDQKDALKALDSYFGDRWVRKSISEKLAVLKAYINHPEEIFYFLMREAITKHGAINKRLAKEGIILIAKAIDPNYARVLLSGDLDAVPGNVPIEESAEKGATPGKEKGMPLVKPAEEEEPGKKLYKTKKPTKVEPSSSRFETKSTGKEKGRFEGPTSVTKSIKKVKSPLKSF